MIVFAILFVVVSIGLIVYYSKNKANLIQIQKEKDLLEHKINSLCSENKEVFGLLKSTSDKLNEVSRDKEIALMRLVETANEKQEIIDESSKEINKLNEQIITMMDETSKEINRLNEQIITMGADEAVLAAKESYSLELEQELKRLEEQIKLRSSELELISTNAASVAVDEKKKLRRLEELEALIKASESRIESGKYALKDIELRYKTMEDKLDDLTILHRSVLALEEGPGVSWIFSVGDKGRLVELIHQLVNEYGGAFPVLKKELLKAE